MKEYINCSFALNVPAATRDMLNKRRVALTVGDDLLLHHAFIYGHTI